MECVKRANEGRPEEEQGYERHQPAPVITRRQMNLGAGAIEGRAGRRAKAAGEHFTTTAAEVGGRRGEGGEEEEAVIF